LSETGKKESKLNGTFTENMLAESKTASAFSTHKKAWTLSD
jgi:hypothetical protein